MVEPSLVLDKSDLERALSPFNRSRPFGKRELEQYPTPTDIVAYLVWIALLKGDIKSAVVADFGCGDGRLAIASVIAGSSRAVCVEIDENILNHGKKVVEENFKELRGKIIYVVADATSILLNSVDTVVMNPPFGVIRRNRGLDLKFLVNALNNARRVYSIHKYSKGLIEMIRNLASEKGLELKWLEELNLAIPMMYQRHRRKIHRVKTVLIALSTRG